MFVLAATIHGSNPATTSSSTKLTDGHSRTKEQTGTSRAGTPTMHPTAPPNNLSPPTEGAAPDS